MIAILIILFFDFSLVIVSLERTNTLFASFLQATPILDKGVTNLKLIKDQDYSNLENILIKNFILNLKT